MILKQGALFICDTAVTANPTVEQVAENTLLAAKVVRRFGLTPRIALIAISNGDDLETESSVKMRDAMKLIQERDSSLEIIGPVRADAALLTKTRQDVMPESNLAENANLLMMPNVESARISYDMLKSLTRYSDRSNFAGFE